MIRSPWLRGLLAIPVVCAAAVAWAAQPSVGDAVSDVELLDETGKAHKLSDYRGKVVVFEWTNPECPYVQRHYKADTMEKLSSELKADGVVWFAVNSTSDNEPKDTLAWKQKQGFEYLTLQDKQGELGKLMGAKTTPHMFVIGPDGKLAYAGAIDDDPRGDVDQPQNYVQSATQALMGGLMPDPSNTQPYGCSVKYSASN